MSAAISDIYEVDVFYSGPSSAIENTFGFQCINNIAGDAQADLGTAFETALLKNTSGGLLYEMTSQFQSAKYRVQDVKPGILATYEHAYGPVLGRLAGDAVPPQCAVVLSMHTTLKGRSFRGRVYLAGLSELDVSGGQLNAGAITAFNTIVTQLLAVFGPGGSNGNWRLAVISRYNGGVKRAVPVSTTVSSISLDTIVRTQRRRVVGVGS